MRAPEIDVDALWKDLLALLEIPSPSGYTDRIVRHLVAELEELGLETELTRRGAIRARLRGAASHPGRAVVAHLDTLGAMVREVTPNGRLAIAPVGTWSARFAEGARVTILGDGQPLRGTILPLKASGHVYNEAVDTQPVAWSNLEIRVDLPNCTPALLEEHGVHIGAFVAIDPAPEITSTGFIASRHLDDKAGVAALLGATRALRASEAVIPVDTHLLFTISEEVGSGASAVLRGDVAELVSIDNATPAPGQGSTEMGATIAMMDSSGPFDYHLTRHLIRLAQDARLSFARDVFRYYRCDAAAAVEAGNDLRTGLVCFGVDASHGYERVHIDSLVAVAQLIGIYLQSPLAVARDERELGPIEGFPNQPASPFPLNPSLPDALPSSDA